LICAVLAATITGVTTQLIASAAGQHPYGIAWTTPPPATIPIAGA